MAMALFLSSCSLAIVDAINSGVDVSSWRLSRFPLLGHTTTAMHDIESPPPLRPPPGAAVSVLVLRHRSIDAALARSV